MARALRYGYQPGYVSWLRRPTWQEGERLDQWNPYYRQDLTGADEEISLEDIEGGKPPTYVPTIDQQALGYKDVLGPRQHPWEAGGPELPTFVDRRAAERGFGDLFGGPERSPGLGERLRSVFREKPSQQSPYGNRPAIILRQSLDSYLQDKPPPASELERAGVVIAKPTPPAQDTQSYWTGSSKEYPPTPRDTQSMAEDPRQKAARMARDYIDRNPWDAASVMRMVEGKGLDINLGAPDWQAPDTGTLTADDMAAPFMSSRPVGTTRSIVEQAPAETAPDPWSQLEDDWQDFQRRRDIDAAPAGRPASPIDAGYSFGRPRQDVQSVADIFGDGGASSPASFASLIAGRPDAPFPPGGLSQMTPNIPAARPDYQAPYSGPAPRDPQPRPWMAAGTMERMREAEAGLPRPRPEEFGPPQSLAGEMPAQFADLRNGPRDISRGLIAGGQEARLPIARPSSGMSIAVNPPYGEAGPRLPQPRPDMPQDVAARPPLIDPGRFSAVPPSPAASPLSARQGLRIPDDASMPAGLAPPIRTGFGNEALGIDPATGMPASQQAARPVPAPIDPAAIAAAKQTLQLHPDTGRIRTAPGFQQFNEPARTRPVPGQVEAPLIRPDLTQAAANYTPPAPLPRARPTPPPIEEIGSDVPGPQSGLPASVMENIARAGPAASELASGGPAENLNELLPVLDGNAFDRPEAGLGLRGTAEDLTAGIPLSTLTAPVGSTRVTRPVQDYTMGHRRAWLRDAVQAPVPAMEDLIAGPEATVPPPVPSPTPPPIVERQTIADTPARAPLIAPTPTAINPRLSPREIERRAAERGFGTVENLTGDRWARGIGAATGVAAGLATGNPMLAASLGGIGYRNADDMRRNYLQGTGPFRFLGGIFGLGRRDRDKDKNKDKYGTPPKSDSSASSPPSSAYSGSRYQGGTYSGQSTGGQYIGEGTGGAFR